MEVGAYPCTRQDVTAPQVRRGEEDERIVKMFDNNHDVVTKLLAMLDAKGLTSKFESRALDRVVSKAQRRLEQRALAAALWISTSLPVTAVLVVCVSHSR